MDRQKEISELKTNEIISLINSGSDLSVLENLKMSQFNSQIIKCTLKKSLDALDFLPVSIETFAEAIYMYGSSAIKYIDDYINLNDVLIYFINKYQEIGLNKFSQSNISMLDHSVYESNTQKKGMEYFCNL